jgi:osmotically-inducible protein OsmY
MKTDMRLRQDVEAELDWCANVDARQIGVSVKDGIVTLSGQVGSYIERRSAQEAVQSIAGVRALANDLVVDMPFNSKRTDADIAAAALQALKANVCVPAERLKVVVHDGWIELQGDVNTWHQRSAAETAVSALHGVHGVTNTVHIQPQISPLDIESKIEEAFRRQAQLDAKKITIKAVDGTVTLEGVVHSWQERQRAETAAWQAPGVVHVVDHLAVQPFPA